MSSRPDTLQSVTYRAYIPPYDEYVSVIISTQEGKIRELFINSDHMESYPWISYLTRTVSKRLQQGEHILHLVNEMKETYDTDGGYIIPKSENTRANSVVGHIAWLIEQEYKRINQSLAN
jgi:hypothetical protein